MVKFEIRHRFNNEILHEGEAESLKQFVEYLVQEGKSLDGASLDGANLHGASLGGANLRGAYLRGAYLSGANLSGANLSGANLRGANLSGAYLHGAYLSGASLGGAYLRGASLDGANLHGATNYSCHHDFFAEIIRRQSTQHFTDSEWSLIGKLIIHRWCWDDLKPHKDILEPILIKLEVLGFGEFLQTMKEKYS